MKVLAEKHKELSQTIALLIGSLRTEKGCRSMQDEMEYPLKFGLLFGLSIPNLSLDRRQL